MQVGSGHYVINCDEEFESTDIHQNESLLHAVGQCCWRTLWADWAPSGQTRRRFVCVLKTAPQFSAIRQCVQAAAPPSAMCPPTLLANCSPHFPCFQHCYTLVRTLFIHPSASPSIHLPVSLSPSLFLPPLLASPSVSPLRGTHLLPAVSAGDMQKMAVLCMFYKILLYIFL